MSLLQSLRSNIVQSISSLPSLSSTTSTFTRRQYWKEVLRVKSYNPKAKKNKVVLEDVEVMAIRSARAQAAEGLLSRQIRYRNYIKPWMKRKRLKEVKKYRSMERGVSNLKKYVQFVNDFNKEG